MGIFLVAPLLLTVRPIVTCGSRVSPAPPRHTLPALQNIDGISINLYVSTTKHFSQDSLAFGQRPQIGHKKP